MCHRVIIFLSDHIFHMYLIFCTLNFHLSPVDVSPMTSIIFFCWKVKALEFIIFFCSIKTKTLLFLNLYHLHPHLFVHISHLPDAGVLPTTSFIHSSMHYYSEINLLANVCKPAIAHNIIKVWEMTKYTECGTGRIPMSFRTKSYMIHFSGHCSSRIRDLGMMRKVIFWKCLPDPEVGNWQLLFLLAADPDQPSGFLVQTHLPQGQENSTSRNPEVLRMIFWAFLHSVFHQNFLYLKNANLFKA